MILTAYIITKSKYLFMFLSGSGGCGKRKYILWIIFFENYENKPIFVVYLSLRAYTKKMKSCGRFFLFL